MQFQSKASAYQVLVRPEVKRFSPDGMVVIDIIPPLTADFAKFDGEYRYENPLTGASDVGVEIRGHFFDSEAAQTENGWSDEDREIVEKVLLRLCDTVPEYIWLFKETPFPAPWPTYDDTHHKQIPTLAAQLGLVEQALSYERQNKNRGEVVEKLEASLVEAQAEEELTVA